LTRHSSASSGTASTVARADLPVAGEPVAGGMRAPGYLAIAVRTAPLLVASDPARPA
jgi:hypothetical protein